MGRHSRRVQKLLEAAAEVSRAQLEADALERKLDQLPAELNPWKLGLAALAATSGIPGARELTARYAFNATRAHVRRKSMKRVR